MKTERVGQLPGSAAPAVPLSHQELVHEIRYDFLRSEAVEVLMKRGFEVALTQPQRSKFRHIMKSISSGDLSRGVVPVPSDRLSDDDPLLKISIPVRLNLARLEIALRNLEVKLDKGSARYGSPPLTKRQLGKRKIEIINLKQKIKEIEDSAKGLQNRF